MQNNEIEKIYSKILDIIKNTNDYCEFFIRDNKFIFQNRTNPKCISIILTDKEILDLNATSDRNSLLAVNVLIVFKFAFVEIHC